MFTERKRRDRHRFFPIRGEIAMPIGAQAAIDGD